MLQNLMHLCQKKKDNQLKISTNIIFKSQKKKLEYITISSPYCGESKTLAYSVVICYEDYVPNAHKQFDVLT